MRESKEIPPVGSKSKSKSKSSHSSVATIGDNEMALLMKMMERMQARMEESEKIGFWAHLEAK